MNIFEQYGIKEVADVTLYAIELDKNDDEIYIPIMYFDTLKVSSLEQSAEQTSARGGVGNAELITWDFGKEITVSLEDALFSPASQSLMWGGKFNIKKTKIYGVWNPYIYETDSTGRQQYIKKIEMPTEDFYRDTLLWKFYHLEIPDKYYGTSFATIQFPNPETLQQDTYTISSVEKTQLQIGDELIDGWYIYAKKDNEDFIFQAYYLTQDDSRYLRIILNETSTQNIPLPLDENYDFSNLYYFVCPCDGEIKWMQIIDNEGHYKYYREEYQGEWGTDHWQEDQLVLIEYNCPKDKPIQESEEIQTIVGKYTLESNFSDSIKWTNNLYPERAVLTIDTFGDFKYQAYEFVSDSEDSDVCYYNEIDVCDTDTNMVKCTTEHIDAYGYTWQKSDLKLMSYEGNQDSYYLEDIDLRYRIRTDNGLREVSLEYSFDNENGYQAKIGIYKNIRINTIVNGEKQEIIKKILVGTFYIINDWNLNGAPPQEFIYEIESGIDNVDYLDRLEKCLAKQTFAIDADKNIRCNNYWYVKEYAQTPLTVFLDPKTMKPFEPNSTSYITKDGTLIEGNLTIIKQNSIYYKRTRTKSSDYTSLGRQIVVDANHFPGTYRLVGETYIRSYANGQDQRYQFEIPLCKMGANNNLTLEAAGDPTTFSMSLRVLRKDDGTMIKFTQYSVEDNSAGSTNIVPVDRLPEDTMNFK